VASGTFRVLIALARNSAKFVGNEAEFDAELDALRAALDHVNATSAGLFNTTIVTVVDRIADDIANQTYNFQQSLPALQSLADEVGANVAEIRTVLAALSQQDLATLVNLTAQIVAINGSGAAAGGGRGIAGGPCGAIVSGGGGAVLRSAGGAAGAHGFAGRGVAHRAGG
jgi:hypothetical protein